ncbi:MAG: hypothetical protein FJ209_00795 [Betaproteobacteria bacterium]|nr:hypothetical protein [Betaproteobacteria bacterium]
MSLLIDVAIGLALVFFLASMLCSGMLEILARFRSARGRLMREGLRGLVPDRWLYLRLINHPMVSGLYRGRPGKGSPPSYLPARNFSLALADTLLLRQRLHGGGNDPLTLDTLRRAVREAKLKDLHVGHALQPVVDTAPDLAAALAGMDAWFDTAMDRVSGWYKAYAQKRLFFIALGVAVLFNVDALRIATSLAHSPAQRAQVAEVADRLTGTDTAPALSLQETRGELRTLADAGLPIGFACPAVEPATQQANWLMSRLGRLGDCLGATIETEDADMSMKLLGWLLTALAVCLGAPFWFDAMKRLVNLRSAGPRPGKAA